MFFRDIYFNAEHVLLSDHHGPNNKSMNLRMSEPFHCLSDFEEQLNVKRRTNNVISVICVLRVISHSNVEAF